MASRTLVLAMLMACSQQVSDSGDSDTEQPFVHPFAGHPALEDGKIYNSAHGCGQGRGPEETMQSCQASWEAGADILEVNINMSSDGVLVCIHDDTVDRTTDGTGAVKNLTWDELSALDAGYGWTIDEGVTYPFRGQGQRLAQLEELLTAFPEAVFSIEIKQRSPTVVPTLVDVLERTSMTGRVFVSSFEDGPVSELREAAPEVLTGLATTEGLALYWLAPEEEATYVPPGWILSAPPTFGDIVLDQATIDKSHRLHVPVHVWTINERDEMERLLDLGADGIITDDPWLFAEVLAER